MTAPKQAIRDDENPFRFQFDFLRFFICPMMGLIQAEFEN
jgi:hypothetical protein